MTADEIARTALDLIDRLGIDAVTIRVLAAELKVTPRALYFHYPNKAAVVAAALDLVWDEATAALAGAPSDPVEFIVHSCLETRRTFLRHPEVALYVTTLPRPGPRLERSLSFIVAVMEQAGFPDVARTYHRYNHYLLSSISLAATKKLASEYFGRTEDALRAWADEVYAGAPLDDPRRRALESHFAEIDEAWFEQGLREMLAVELAPRDLAVPRTDPS